MPDLRKLKDEALEAIDKGDWRKAAWCYANLEREEPQDPTWSLKLGEALRKLGNKAQAVQALGRAAHSYANDNLLLKAIAVCKIILGIDPAHTQTQEMLAALHAYQRMPEEPEADSGPVEPAREPIGRATLPARSPEGRTREAAPRWTPSPPTAVPSRSTPVSPTAVPSRSTPVSPTAVPSRSTPVSPTAVPSRSTPVSPTSLAEEPTAPVGPPIMSAVRPPQTSPGGTAGLAADPLPESAAAPPPVPAPPLQQLRLAALVPGSRQSQNLRRTDRSAAIEIPVDEFPSSTRAATSPHRGAGRHTMATFILPKTPFFSVLPPPLMKMAIDRVRLIELPAGQVLFSRGDPGDQLYVVAWGEVAVLVPGRESDAPAHEVARLGEGEFFGEIALLSDQPRTGTVRATVDSKVLAFDRQLLGDLVAASPDLLVVLLRFLRERLIANLADMSALFAPFTPLERLALATRFLFVEVDEGLCMVDEGIQSAGLFVLLAGEAQATAAGKVVARLGPGDVFGETSLITGQPANATVTAARKSFLLFLPVADFSEVIMTHPQVLEYLASLVESRSRAIGRLDIL